MSVGNRLKILRDAQSLSQTQLANLLFKSKNCVSAWEANRNEIDNESLILLSKIFNVSTDFIINNQVLERTIHFKDPTYQQLKLLLKVKNLDTKNLNYILNFIDILNDHKKAVKK